MSLWPLLIAMGKFLTENSCVKCNTFHLYIEPKMDLLLHLQNLLKLKTIFRYKPWSSDDDNTSLSDYSFTAPVPNLRNDLL